MPKDTKSLEVKHFTSVDLIAKITDALDCELIFDGKSFHILQLLIIFCVVFMYRKVVFYKDYCLNFIDELSEKER